MLGNSLIIIFFLIFLIIVLYQVRAYIYERRLEDPNWAVKYRLDIFGNAALEATAAFIVGVLFEPLADHIYVWLVELGILPVRDAPIFILSIPSTILNGIAGALVFLSGTIIAYTLYKLHYRSSAFLVMVGISIAVLVLFNETFSWGWNFPDIIGIVGTIVAIIAVLRPRLIESLGR